MQMNSKPTFAILVSQKYSLSHHPDDLALQSTLHKLGCNASIVPWDDTSVSYQQFDTAVVRSCWDYQHRLPEFIKRMQAIEQHCRLVNNASTIIWNSNKRYLQWLSDHEVPTVPSFFIDDHMNLTPFCWNFSTDKVIVKPSIGASGHHTYLVDAQDFNSIKKHVLHLTRNQSAVLQPFIKSVQTDGERSAVIIDGDPVFAMKKKPAENGFLVHEHWGGTYSETFLTHKDRLFLKHLIKVLNPIPMFMRVDFLYDEQQQPLLLELEMIEPNLYLSRNPLGLKKLCNALIR